MTELRVWHAGKQWAVPLSGGVSWRIGRSEPCEICVPDSHISVEHASISSEGGKWLLRRTAGQLAVELDGRPVDYAELRSGSVFSIGTTEFMLVIEQEGVHLIDAAGVLAADLSSAKSGPEAAEGQGCPVSMRRSPVAMSRLFAQVLSSLARAHERTVLAKDVLELACERLVATRAMLAKVKDGQSIDLIATRGIPADGVKGLVSTSVLRCILDQRQAIFIGNTGASLSSLAQQKSIVRNHIQAVACTPVFDSAGKLAAVLYVDNQSRPAAFDPLDVQFLIWLGLVYSLLDENLEMRRRLESEVSEMKRTAASSKIIAETPAMLLLFERTQKAAASDAAVLIQGESGTGKECIARMLHRESARAAKPFVARNCAAIPETLFESEMFGHKKGAFTGATADRRGAFAEADGGTLFLDEIGDLTQPLQAKLLRAIEDKAIRPVGAETDVPVDVRLICATNKELREACRNKEFREDLYYRIATVTLNVPPLRERRADILPLAHHFIQLYSGGSRVLAQEAEELLLSYEWPGNVRELRSIMEQAVIFAGRNEIQIEDINLPARASTRIDLHPQSLADAERRHILRICQECNGNKTEAARILGIARSTLILKLNAYSTVEQMHKAQA
jgi:transcriptional regulator with PAS, ATPase and Fis domain